MFRAVVRAFSTLSKTHFYKEAINGKSHQITCSNLQSRAWLRTKAPLLHNIVHIYHPSLLAFGFVKYNTKIYLYLMYLICVSNVIRWKKVPTHELQKALYKVVFCQEGSKCHINPKGRQRKTVNKSSTAVYGSPPMDVILHGLSASILYVRLFGI